MKVALRMSIDITVAVFELVKRRAYALPFNVFILLRALPMRIHRSSADTEEFLTCGEDKVRAST